MGRRIKTKMWDAEREVIERRRGADMGGAGVRKPVKQQMSRVEYDLHPPEADAMLTGSADPADILRCG